MNKKGERKLIVVGGGNLIDGSGVKPKKDSVVVVEGTKERDRGQAGNWKLRVM